MVEFAAQIGIVQSRSCRNAHALLEIGTVLQPASLAFLEISLMSMICERAALLLLIRQLLILRAQIGDRHVQIDW